MEKGRHDYITHVCLRCYAAENCSAAHCRHYIVDGNFLVICEFCSNLSDRQCEILREPDRHLFAHFGLLGNIGFRVADALGISRKHVIELD